jgi:hypothetical protein
VEVEVTRLRAAGEPITTADLYAFHGARGPDTTPAWIAVLDSLPEQQFGTDGAALPIVGEGDKELLRSGDESLLSEAEAFLEKYERTRRLAHHAASLPGECRYPVAFEQGVGALLPHAQKLRSVVRLLALDLQVQVARGNTDAAVDSLDAMFAASESLAHQLTLVEHLVRIATQGVALHETLHVLNTMPLSDEQLVRLQSRIESCDLPGGLAHSMLGERAMGYHAFHHMSLNAAMGQGDVPVGNAPDGTLTRPADLEKYLEILAELIDASRESFPAARQQAQSIDAKTKALATGGNPFERMKYQMTALVTPAAGASFDATARGIALRDLVRMAIAAQRYRLQTGAWPAQAADLVPQYLSAVPVDPFDGQPLRFVVNADELLLYSIGKDGRDDGGSDPDGRGEPDIAVRLKTNPQSSQP